MLVRKKRCGGIWFFEWIIGVDMIVLRVEMKVGVVYVGLLKRYNMWMVLFEIREEMHFCDDSPEGV